MEKNTGKVREFPQSGKVGTMYSLLTSSIELVWNVDACTRLRKTVRETVNQVTLWDYFGTLGMIGTVVNVFLRHYFHHVEKRIITYGMVNNAQFYSTSTVTSTVPVNLDNWAYIDDCLMQS